MLLIILVFLLFPILGLPIYCFLYFLDKNKKGMVYSLLIGFSFGLMAYYFIPPSDYDLFRHQLVVKQFFNIDFNQFIHLIKDMDLELIPLLYSYVIAIIQNIDLLQFFVVTFGYSILLYLLYDYRKIANISFLPFLGIVLFTIFGFYALYFISGLYFYIAIIIFALTFYYDYIKNGNKIIIYLLYFITLFIHNAMFFPIGILIIYKIFKNKFNLKSLLVCLFIFGFAGYVLNFISTTIDIHILNSLTDTYNTYIKSNDRMHRFYSGTIFYIEITKLIVTIICIFVQKERKKIDGVNGFLLLLSISNLIVIPQSIVMIRFVMLIQFIGIIPMIDCFRKFTKNKLILLFVILVLSGIYIYYFYHILSAENFGDFFSEKIYDNIFNIFRR